MLQLLFRLPRSMIDPLLHCHIALLFRQRAASGKEAIGLGARRCAARVILPVLKDELEVRRRPYLGAL